MSHLTHIQTQIKNPIALEKVLREMIVSGLEGILIGAHLETDAEIRDPFGHSKIANFVIRRQQSFQGGYDFGFRVTETGDYEFLTRDGSKRDARTFMEKLKPWYAREATLAALNSQGFDIESIREENGEVVIVAGKWVMG